MAMSEMIFEKLEAAAGSGNVRLQEQMALHTTFRIGGPADYFVTPATAGQLVDILCVCREEGLPVTVVGNGSNLLVSDDGIKGVVLAIADGKIPLADVSGEVDQKQELTSEIPKNAETDFSLFAIRMNGNRLWAGAGVKMSVLAGVAARAGLSGLAFAGGIPGALGGGILMNAGAYDGELKDHLVQVWLCDKNGKVSLVPAAELELGYRTSRMLKSGEIVLAAEFELGSEEPEQIFAHIRDLNGRRRDKQPLEYPSAGSTFKRPEGYFAGKLIQDAGLAGFRVGDAQVSEKHCGFVVNRGSATAADVTELIRQVQERVYAEFGVHLETEVRFVGEF